MLRCVALAGVLGVAAGQAVSLHGSGTTNPKKVHWELMSQMEAMASTPVEMSYRAIGSSKGLEEFLAKKSHFGCAEIPVAESQKTTGETILQMPMVLGAMSVFHSIPDAHVGTAGLELTPCMLAKIFSRTITQWNDPLLREGGVNLGLAQVAQEIKVYHRTHGSSTTKFFTKYLTEATQAAGCTADWTAGTGSTVVWDAGTHAVLGSGGMSAALQANSYGIGYIDSGHGHDDGLKEVKLQNLAGNFVDSVSVGEDGVLAAADAAAAAGTGTIPLDGSGNIDPTGNWEAVNLINQAGPDTWPIVAISYLMVHQDQTTSGDIGSLLQAYLKMAMDTNKLGGQKVLSKYNFFPITDAMRTANLAAIDLIATATSAQAYQLAEMDGDADTTTGPLEGSFSSKRTSHELRLLGDHDKKLNELSSLLKSGHDMSIPLEMHGSGTTNPSKLIWKMMATLKGMALRPLHLSYRAIGSSSGIKEFIAGNSHFGSAEIPLTQANKIEVSGDENAPAEVLQFPLVLGAMSAFHSVPAEYLNGADGLHLTPCVLGKIFSRQITVWNHADIVDLNPDANLPDRGIVMLHRKKGSSTTNFFTKYLHTATEDNCAADWPLGWGAALTLAAGDYADLSALQVKYPDVTGLWADDEAVTDAGGGVVTCEGSGQMASNLADIPFAIGYIDSGHGHDDGLSEVKLRNAAGTYLDSTEAGVEGIGAAAAAADFPATSAGNFETVDMLNQAGANTWPIVAASYLFVKRDMTPLGETAVAVKAFLEYAMSNEKGYSSTKGGQKFAADFNFVPLPQSLLDLNNAGIATLQLPEDTQPFQWEWSTDTTVGPQRNTLSCKRSNYETYALNSHGGRLEEVNEQVQMMVGELPHLTVNVAPSPAPPVVVEIDASDLVVQSDDSDDSDDSKKSDSNDAIAMVALVIAIVSLLLNIALLCRGNTAVSQNAAACATPQERRYSTHDDSIVPKP